MSSFVLKIIACITMLIDHLSYCIYGKLSWMNYIGRIAFPIFAFQIVQGYIHTKDVKKYFLRLIGFALLSQIPFALFHSIASSSFSLNVLFTLFLGLLCIFIWDKSPSKLFALFFALITALLADAIHTDYGAWGVLLIFGFYLTRNHKWSTATFFTLYTVLRYGMALVQNNFYYKNYFFAIGTLFALVPILLYNQKQGKKIKYFLYVFYPLHLLLLYGIHYWFFA